MSKKRNKTPFNSIRKVSLTVTILLCLLSVFSGSAVDYSVKTIPNTHLSDRNNFVSNPDGIISAEAVNTINLHLKALQDSLGIEVAVVAVESIGDNDARMFATELFKHWGIGKKANDNGLLIQLITEPQQRSVVFETGYGLEGVLPDAICYRLQQQHMIPDMKSGDYSSGMLKGVIAVKEYLLASNYEREAMIGTSSDDEPLVWALILLFFGFPLLILLVVAFAYYRKRRPRVCPKCGRKTLVYVKRQTIRQPTYQAEGLAADIYRCKNCGYTGNKKHPISRLQRSVGPLIGGGGGLGSGRSGGFGGGFGGGSWGGGSSGGGGSISRF